MGRADSDKAGGSGNKGGGSPGGSKGSGTGGGRQGGGYVDNDAQRADVERNHAAASQNDAQSGENSRQGSGRGDVAGNGDRRGMGPSGSGGESPAARARDAMTRHQRSRTQPQAEGATLSGPDLGIGESYSHADAITERAKTGAVSPREMDMAVGYHSGKQAALAEQGVGTLAAGTMSRATGVPGIGRATKTAVGQLAGSTVSTPETEYGSSVARARASNTMAQTAAQVGASMVAGPVGGFAAGAVNTVINDRRTQDISRMSEALGLNGEGAKLNGSGNGATEGLLAEARSFVKSDPTPLPFSWKPVSINQYGQGLMSLAQNS